MRFAVAVEPSPAPATRTATCIVVALDQAAPTDSDWNALLEWYRPVPPARVLIHSIGGVPNAAQRVKLREALAGSTNHISAGISSSRMARAVGTAISWFVPTLRTFAPDEEEAALTHLRVDARDRARMKSALAELLAERAAMRQHTVGIR